MRIAIVHDYIKEYGGAERVLEALHEIWPDAPVFTTVYLPSFLGPHKERFKNWKIRTSWFQYIPFKGKLISPLRILAPLLFRSFDFSKFDVIIVSQTGAYTPNVIQKSKVTRFAKASARRESQKLICYSHTPPRYLYGYATAREWKKNKLMNIAGTLMNHILRMVDYKSSQNVDFFIANSINVQKRIEKFYRRDAKVIYPPVEVSKGLMIKDEGLKKEYYLAGGRIARPKHIDLIVKTFEELKLPLKVFGRPFAGHDSLFKIHHSNVEFVGEVTDEEKFNLMRDAKAFIFASEDEDFGITPVEAMAVGTPVIAYRSGGVLETIIDPSDSSGQVATGLFFDELNSRSLKNAIKRASNMHFDTGKIKIHAEKFSKERFKKEIKEFVEAYSK